MDSPEMRYKYRVNSLSYASKRQHHGVHPEDRRVYIEPVKEHVAWLRSKGCSLTAIAIEVGLTPAALAYMMRWQTRYTRLRLAKAILAVDKDLAFRPEANEMWRKAPKATPENLARLVGPRVLKVGAVRRVRALQRMGWPIYVLSEKVGFNVANLCQDDRGVRCTLMRYEAIKRVYDELWNVPGPSHGLTIRSTRKGYAPPLAWSEDTIDDPKARPKGVVNIKLPPCNRGGKSRRTAA